MYGCGSITFGVCACVLCGEVCWTAETYELPEDDLNDDRNMLERF